MNEREELEALRRLAELEAKAAGKSVPAVVAQKAEPTTAQKIAADPFTRLAIGAAEPFQALIQRLSERGLKTGNPMLAGLGAIAAQARPGLDTAMAETKQMARDAGFQGTDMMGILGNMASPLSLAAGKTQIPATLMGKTALGAGLGAAGGTLAPAESDAASRSNTAIGATIGGMLPPLIQGGAKTVEAVANTGRSIVDLVSKQGPQNIINRYIRGDKVVGEKQLPTLLQKIRGADDLIEGGNPTVAEAVVGAPEGSPLAALQTIVSKTGGGNSARFGERLAQQESAVKAAEAARDAAAEPARAAALEAAKRGGVSAVPVIAKVDRLARTEGFRASDVASKSLADIQGKLTRFANPETGVINPQDLYTIRKEIGSTIKKYSVENASWDKGMTAKLEREIQLSIDDAIEAAGGTGWKKYLDNYAKASRLIDAYKTRQELALKPPQPTNLGGGLNVAEETRPHMPNLLSRPAMIANWAMRKAGSGIEPRLDKALADMMLDPQEFIRQMEKAPPLTRIEIENWLRKSNALTAGAASTQ